MNTLQEKLKSFERILGIMDTLRQKCPWDKKQTMESLIHLTIEEVYELADAIGDNNLEEIKKELGDVLLHIVFYSKIGSEMKSFDICDVINTECDKLIERHPHIYGDANATDEKQVRELWEKVKIKNGSKGILSGVPKGLPSVVKAVRLKEKTSAVGFDFKDASEAFSKVKEEFKEFENEVYLNNRENIEKELGDLFFSLITYANFLGIDPENALSLTNKKFIKRFEHIEQMAKEQGKKIEEMSLQEMNQYWNEAKKSK